MAPKCFHLSQQKDPNSEHLDKSCICVSHNWDHILSFFCDCCYTTKLNMQPHIPGGSFCIAAILQLGLRMFKSLTIINFCAMSLKAFIGFFSWTLPSYFIVSLVPAPYEAQQYNNSTIQLFLHWLGSVMYLYNYCFHVGAYIPNFVQWVFRLTYELVLNLVSCRQLVGLGGLHRQADDLIGLLYLGQHHLGNGRQVLQARVEEGIGRVAREGRRDL